MKLSDNTVNILKNFSSINSGIQFDTFYYPNNDHSINTNGMPFERFGTIW